MPVQNYKLWGVGGQVEGAPGRPAGVMGAIHIGISAVAKKAIMFEPMAVVNEVLAANLGRGLCLPIPPNSVIQHGGEPYFFSLNFNLTGESLPPCDAQQLVADMPDLSSGIIVFDSWIVNGDRHPLNLAYMPSTGQVQVFDHSHALLKGPDGMDAMYRFETSLPLKWHCLAMEITTAAHLTHWVERIQSIPDFFIEDAIEAGLAVGLSQKDANACYSFLLRRREKLPKLLRESRHLFPKMQDEFWTPFEGAQ